MYNEPFIHAEINYRRTLLREAWMPRRRISRLIPIWMLTDLGRADRANG